MDHFFVSFSFRVHFYGSAIAFFNKSKSWYIYWAEMNYPI
ncbi:hypothetical protein M096_4366 [Parabacteroides distasonis str. 3999B T(B) 6]|nr:hypothetical protein M095_3375 [Parabacteroides distasonis str. 3999B T(B) 4]KDS66408.1 hypothetical protein M096_4366 [Parabacteroides distasonis str. 3999B T(B) 6]